MGKHAPAKYIWHCVLRAAPGDPPLGDGAWLRITARVMDRIGLSEHGCEHDGVRWIAVHHGDQHVHIVATLARQDFRRADVNNLYWRIGAALVEIEKEHGLRELVRDKTADKAPTQAEMAKARAAGRTEPARATLRRIVQAAAAAARADTDFFAAVEARGARARPRYSTVRPGEITGYAVALPGNTGPGGRPIWYGGGTLASDLTLPKLRQRWAGPDGRLTGRAMGGPTGRVALAREALRAARVARSEPEFFALLERAGLQVPIRPDPGRSFTCSRTNLLMNSTPAWLSRPPRLLTAYGASRFHLAEPELSGLGVTTSMSGRNRSSQSLMFFGLPLRTTSVTTDPNGIPFVPSVSHSLATLPALTNRVISGSTEKFTTSAGFPLTTPRD